MPKHYSLDYTADDLLVVPGKEWSLHHPEAEDEDINEGTPVGRPLLTGYGRIQPDISDYIAALSELHRRHPPRYLAREDSGAELVIEADSSEEAIEQAKEWAADGSYDRRVMVTVRVWELDAHGETREDAYWVAEVEAGPAPEEPPCDSDDGHDWRRPVEVVGGVDANPGWFALNGTATMQQEVCARCGMYKTTRYAGAGRRPDELDETVSYDDPDELSLAWVREHAGA